MRNYKQNTMIPNYLDGKFKLYKITQANGKFPLELIKDTKKEIFFELLSISDRLKFESEQREKKITMKIRTQQTKEITSLNVLKIDNEYHKVFNVYHFTNKEGFQQTDLTLESYPNPKLEGEI